MKYWLTVVLLLFGWTMHAQTNTERLRKLKTKLAELPADTNRILVLADLSNYYNTVNVDSSQFFANEALKISEELGFKRGSALALLCLGTLNLRQGNVPLTIDYLERSIQLADILNDYKISCRSLSAMGLCMVHLEDYYRAIEYYKRALEYQKKLGNKDNYIIMIQMDLADAYLDNNNFTEAEHYLNQALAWGEEKNSDYGWLLNMFGSLNLQKKNYSISDSILHLAWKRISKETDIFNKADNRYYFAKLKLAQGEIQSAHDYAADALRYYQMTGFTFDLERIYKVLSTIESKRGRIQQSLDYLILSDALRDSTQNSRARNSAVLFEQHEKENQLLLDKKEKALQEAEARNQQIILIASLLVFGTVTAGLLFFIWQKQRSNKMLLKINQTVLDINASKDRLFSIIGHDLRGPLNALTAFSTLLLHHADSLSKEELKKLSKEFDESLKNLFNLLENLLEWSQSQTGIIDFKPEVFNLSSMLKENLELFKGIAQDKNITLVNENSSTIFVNAHQHSINTVLRNLLSNAIKFTPRDGKVTLRTEKAGKKVRVYVMDTGLGISEETMQKLFKIGTKHSTLGTAKEKGTGLGLVLCKEFVEKNGGTIGVESEEDKGSAFYFTVPLAIN